MNTPRAVRRALIGLVVAIVIGTPSRAENAETDVAPERILSPTLGRPVFVAPGKTFAVRAVVPAGAGAVQCALVHAGWDAQRIALDTVADAAARMARGEALVVKVPADTPQRTYDLEIRVGATVLQSPHSVAVTDADGAIRLVHLSDMNVGDLSAPRFDERLVGEINLVAPTAIVMTGDYLDATHPDPRAGWRDLVDFVSRFDAPIIMACGDHDEIGLYSELVAPSPIGSIQVGRHRCLVLFDHPGAPIDRDADQVRWVESLTRRSPGDGLTFVVSHDDYPNLLAYWQRQGTLQAMVRSGRIGLWISGGHLDWDGVENAGLVSAAAPMLYVRTHQAGRATLGGADGISHYRIIDVDGDRIAVPADSPASRTPARSTAAGHLHARAIGANDGSAARVAFEASSSLPYAVDRLAFWLRVRKSGATRPWCRGGRIDEVIEQPTFWECRVRFDLPDKSVLRGAIGTNAPPVEASLAVQFQAVDALDFRERRTPDGLRYLEGAVPVFVIEITNKGDRAAAVAPQIRLDGEALAYRPSGDDQPFVRRMPLTIEPGKAVRLQVDFSAVRVSPGLRTLQVYAGSASELVPFVHAVQVRVVR